MSTESAEAKLAMVQELRDRLARSTNLDFNMVGLMLESILHAESREELDQLTKDVLEFEPRREVHPFDPMNSDTYYDPSWPKDA